MYSREEKTKAVELYIRYDFGVADTIRELGYPDRKTLHKWYRQHLEEERTGITWEPKIKKYSQEEKDRAVAYYLEHGRSLSRTIKKLGYPSQEYLAAWIDELQPGTRKTRQAPVPLLYEQQKDAVIDLCMREGSAQSVADEHEVSRCHLYVLRRRLLRQEKEPLPMKKSNEGTYAGDVDALKREAADLQRQVDRLKMEKDILEVTKALLKKDMGVDPQRLTNKEKAELADALRPLYPLDELLRSLRLPRSSYYYQRKGASRPDKYGELRTVVRELFEANFSCYGYRRLHIRLHQVGYKVSEKVVRRLMVELSLRPALRGRRKYSSYVGEVSPAVPNLVGRDFHADAPNQKWLTDITEFAIPAGKVYLSPIIDCFDGLVRSWSMGTRPDAHLVNSMLEQAMGDLSEDERPMVHSDRGCHYRWPGWIGRMKRRSLVRSMSRKGCPPDNAACEGFFGRLKNEMFYGRGWTGVSLEQFMDILDHYLLWYNHSRIKQSLGGMSPMQYRKSLGLCA